MLVNLNENSTFTNLEHFYMVIKKYKVGTYESRCARLS